MKEPQERLMITLNHYSTKGSFLQEAGSLLALMHYVCFRAKNSARRSCTSAYLRN